MNSLDEAEPFSILRGCRPINAENLFEFFEGAHSTLNYRGMIHEEVHRAYKWGDRSVEFDFDRYFGASDSLLDVENMLVTAERTEWPANEHLGQLLMYGVLQALAVQNQATLQVLKCFGQRDFFFQKDILDQIKELRIAVAGHPSNHNNKNLTIKGCTFLGHRAFGTRTKFTIVTYENFAKSVHREIDVLSLITSQCLGINANLCRVWRTIKENGGISANLFSEKKQ